MTKRIRRKVIVAQIQKKLETYDRRIQKMAESAYKLRQFLQTLLQEESQDASNNRIGTEATGESDGTNRECGESNVHSDAGDKAVLG